MKPFYYVLPLTHLLAIKNEVGWGNGYVAVPKGHPWYGKDYDNIEVEVHGGLTYSSDGNSTLENTGTEGVPESIKDMWIVGFDCAHCGDNPQTCPKEYVEEEAKRLLGQAIEAGRMGT